MSGEAEERFSGLPFVFGEHDHVGYAGEDAEEDVEKCWNVGSDHPIDLHLAQLVAVVDEKDSRDGGQADERTEAPGGHDEFLAVDDAHGFVAESGEGGCHETVAEDKEH